MITFAKSQLSASIASATDYLLTILFVEVIGAWYVAGNAIGTAVGGFINFNLNRNVGFSEGI